MEDQDLLPHLPATSSLVAGTLVLTHCLLTSHLPATLQERRRLSGQAVMYVSGQTGSACLPVKHSLGKRQNFKWNMSRRQPYKRKKKTHFTFPFTHLTFAL